MASAEPERPRSMTQSPDKSPSVMWAGCHIDCAVVLSRFGVSVCLDLEKELMSSNG